MFDSPQLIRAQIEERIRSRLREILEELVADDLASQFVDSAVAVKPWSQNQLLTLRERSGFTRLNLSGLDVPSVVYYKPLAAASLAVSALTGILGAADGLLIALCVISGILTIGNVRTAASMAESLVFWIVYSTEGHSISRVGAKARFEIDAKSIPEIEIADFEPALHSLTRLGCLRIVGNSIDVADKVILHWN